MEGNSKTVTERTPEQSKQSIQTTLYSAVDNKYIITLQCESIFLLISMFVCLFVDFVTRL
jgi:hypothetical protein